MRPGVDPRTETTRLTTTPATPSHARSVGLAVLTMCAGMFCLSVNDAFAKWLTTYYDPIQLVFVRNLLALPMVTAAVIAFRGAAALRTRHTRLHALRGILLVAGSVFFFIGLQHLPLAEATSLVFAAPIFITALSVALLGDRVGWRRWTAVVVGFVGVMIVVRPGTAAFQPASFYVVATALLYALIMLSARRIDRAEGVWTLMFYVVLFPALFSAIAVTLVWRPVDTAHLPLFVAMAVLGTLGLTLISQAFRMAPAAVVAPFDYTALIWATLLGWLVWRELPDHWTYVGAAVIILSGIYIVIRETRQP